MAKQKEDEDLAEMRFRYPKQIHNELNNISANTGIPAASLVKRKIIEIIESFPARFREPKPKD